MGNNRCVGRYIELGPREGDYERFEFSVDCQGEQPKSVSVKVSHSIMAIENKDMTYWLKVSAQAVKEFIQGRINKDHYQNNFILITIYWKPTTCEEKFTEFEIPLAPPPMGFNLD